MEDFINDFRYLNDQRIMETLGALMGINISTGGAPDDASQAAEATTTESAPEQQPAEPATAEQQQQQQQEPEDEMTPEEQEERQRKEDSKKAKEAGTECYKKRQFEDALAQYGKAWELDDSDVTILTNKGGTSNYKLNVGLMSQPCTLRWASTTSAFRRASRQSSAVASCVPTLNLLRGTIPFRIFVHC
jgi:hypothetical protein